MRKDRKCGLEERESVTAQITQNPYSPHNYLNRALCHENLGYPDLAASDAYRALLLTDELSDEDGEYHKEVVDSYAPTKGEENDLAITDDNKGAHVFCLEAGEDSEEENSFHSRNAKLHVLQSYIILARTLLTCGDLKSAYDITERGLAIFKSQRDLQMLQGKIWEMYDKGCSKNDFVKEILASKPKERLPEDGSVLRQIYPWNGHEPDRFSEEHLSNLNYEISKVAPKCEVLVTELPLLRNQDSNKINDKSTTVKQFGIFASSDVGPFEVVLQEPSVLTSSTGLHDPFCDACSTRLPPFSLESPLPTCANCEDIYFCSQACLDRAQDLYHPAICGITDFDVVAKDPSVLATTSALYTLLIARTIAMAETKGTHPLDLPHIRYLWGDFDPPSDVGARNLPFSFSNNIARPLHLLYRLDKNPFAPENLKYYDTWVFNTLLAKFHGVANAKMNERTGVPEVAGVHWLWSLANHSCAPNVQWDWRNGRMGFIARGGKDIVRWGERINDDTADGTWSGGIKAGQEILNHYCDVNLPVEERREWAAGALGGFCVCERCFWEEKESAREKT